MVLMLFCFLLVMSSLNLSSWNAVILRLWYTSMSGPMRRWFFSCSCLPSCRVNVAQIQSGLQWVFVPCHWLDCGTLPRLNCLLKIYSWVHMMWVSIPSIWQLCSTLMMGVFFCHINTHDLVGTPDLVGTSPSVLWHCWLGDRNGIRSVKKTGCWFVGGDDLTGALHNLQLQ